MAQQNITRLTIREFPWYEYEEDIAYYAERTGSDASSVIHWMYRKIKGEDFTLLVRDNCLILLKAEGSNLHIEMAIGGGNECFSATEEFSNRHEVKTWTFSSVRKGAERIFAYMGVSGMEAIRKIGDRVYFRRTL